MTRETRDIVERLRVTNFRDGGLPDEAAAEITRLRALNADMLAALNAARIWMKNKDRSPREEQLYDAIRIAIAECERRGETG